MIPLYTVLYTHKHMLTIARIHVVNANSLPIIIINE